MRFVVFSGTADGRAVCEWLAGRGADVTACVATGYGAELMDNCQTHTGRLDRNGMSAFLKDGDVVVDATHPYAREVSENLYGVCRERGIMYLRLLRGKTDHGGAVMVSSVRAAAEYLKDRKGRVFVSTGSKELSEFSMLGSRVTARVLDTAEVREACGGLGIGKILYKMPPFSYEDNMRDFAGCDYLVTKDGGTAGGTPEKLRAARELGMKIIMIERPEERDGGHTFGELKEILNGLIGEDG